MKDILPYLNKIILFGAGIDCEELIRIAQDMRTMNVEVVHWCNPDDSGHRIERRAER